MDPNESVLHVLDKKRTLGDGMDHSLLPSVRETVPGTSGPFTITIRPSTTKTPSFKPVEPQSQIHHLVPRYVPRERTQPKYLTRKPKEPKFVPYEPYKGAIEPIVARKRPQVTVPIKSSKNNVEIQELVTQMSVIRIAEMSKARHGARSANEEVISMKRWQHEKQAYETDIRNLRETNAHLENQLKFQAQVNSELKTLLVAAVGEDLESRVQHLTEDKLQLARALLKSANHLTSHQEQTEWLSGQCEVWRSKFLASSLMVEELARWKSALSNRIGDLQECTKGLLDDKRLMQIVLLKMHRYLRDISSHLSDDLKESQEDLLKFKKSNIVDLCNIDYGLVEKIGEALNVPVSSKENNKSSGITQHTLAEKVALKHLQHPVSITTTKQDAICNALMGAAMSLTGEQMYLQHPQSHAACCAHCTGDVKDL